MASGFATVPFDHAPLVANKTIALTNCRYYEGTVAIQNRFPPLIAPDICLQPYLVDYTTPYLRLGVCDQACGGELERFTLIPLASLDYLLVESGELSDLPGVVEQWSPRNDSPAPMPDSLKPIKNRNTYIFNIVARRLQNVQLKWYGNRYEHMSVRSREVLDLFADEARVELDVLMVSHNKKNFENVKLFTDACNEIHRLKKGNHGGHSTGMYPPKPRVPIDDEELAMRLHPQNPRSPLYDIIGPGSGLVAADPNWDKEEYYEDEDEDEDDEEQEKYGDYARYGGCTVNEFLNYLERKEL